MNYVYGNTKELDKFEKYVKSCMYAIQRDYFHKAAEEFGNDFIVTPVSGNNLIRFIELKAWHLAILVAKCKTAARRIVNNDSDYLGKKEIMLVSIVDQMHQHINDMNTCSSILDSARCFVASLANGKDMYYRLDLFLTSSNVIGD